MGRKSNHLYVCFDPGTSLSKILYRVGERGKLKFLTMEPESLSLPASSASSLSTNIFGGKPSDRAWVRLSSDGDCHLIGRLALDYRTSISIKEFKHESLVLKILAAVGAIAQSEKLSTQLELNLAILLPMDEYTNRLELEFKLKEAAKSFWFQDCHYQISLNQYSCNIEGFGIALAHIANSGLQHFQSQQLVYLMFGYRNTSLLFFRNGMFSQNESYTTLLGFYNKCDRLTSRLSGLSREEIQSAICTRTEGFYNPDTVSREYRQVTEIVVDDLVTTRDRSKVEKEKETIAAAIEVATEEYWRQLQKWLDKALPLSSKLDGLVCCGGASEFLADRLSEYLKTKNKTLCLKRTKEIEDSLLVAVELNPYEQKVWLQQNLGMRFADVWGLYQYFTNSKTSVKRSAKTSQSSSKKRATSKKVSVSN
jgi:hypothetical protein